MLTREAPKNQFDHMIFRPSWRERQRSAPAMRIAGSSASILLPQDDADVERTHDQEEPDRWDGGMT